MTVAYLTIEGSYARMSGVPDDIRDDVLSVPSDKAEYSKAYIEGRWDGRHNLYRGDMYPAGLTSRLVDRLKQDTYTNEVIIRNECSPLGISGFDASYLKGYTLWDWQVSGCNAILSNNRGVIKVPTSGGKTLMAAAIARKAFLDYGYKTLIMTSKKGIVDQMVRTFSEVCGDVMTVGQMGDGVRSVGDVTIGTSQTLISYQPRTMKVKDPITKRKRTKRIPADANIRKLLRSVNVLILDEAHHTSAATWYAIAMDCAASYRYGLSGTPLKSDDLADAMLLGATGDVIYEIKSSVLFNAGKSARPKIVMVASYGSSSPIMPSENDVKLKEGIVFVGKKWPEYRDAYKYGVVDSIEHNDAVVRATTWLVDNKRRVLVLCRQKSQWACLKAMFTDSGLNFTALWGATDTATRHNAKKAMDEGKLQVILATVIFDEGEDVPGIDSMVLAEGIKVYTNAVQRIGRGMRREKGGYADVWIVDFVPMCHPLLIEHAVQRQESYTGEGYVTGVLSDWPTYTDHKSERSLLPFNDWDDFMEGQE